MTGKLSQSGQHFCWNCCSSGPVDEEKKKKRSVKNYPASKERRDKWQEALGEGWRATLIHVEHSAAVWADSLHWRLTKGKKKRDSDGRETCKIRGLAYGLPIVGLIKKWLIIMRSTSNNHWAIKSWLSGVNNACDYGREGEINGHLFIYLRQETKLKNGLPSAPRNLHCDKGAIHRNTCLVNDNDRFGNRRPPALLVAPEKNQIAISQHSSDCGSGEFVGTGEARPNTMSSITGVKFFRWWTGFFIMEL